MWYPSKYVLLTDLDLNNKLQNDIKSDTKCSENHNNNIINNNNNNNDSNKKKISVNNNVNISNNNSAVNCETMKPYRFSEIEKEYIESSVSNFCDGIQKSAAGVLPERAWQDSIMNPAYTEGTSLLSSVKSEHKVDKNESAQSENNIENSINVANGIESSSKANTSMSDMANTWNFIDPTLIKMTCGCSRQVLSKIFYPFYIFSPYYNLIIFSSLFFFLFVRFQRRILSHLIFLCYIFFYFFYFPFFVFTFLNHG
jgi:hypothetical protein